MKLTTKLSHARIRTKHKLLRMRLQHPLLYRLLALLALAVAAGGLAAAYVFLIAPKDTKTYAEQFNVVIETYSLNGPITAINGNSFTMESSVIETNEGVNSVKAVTRSVNFTDATAIYITTLNGKEISSKTGTRADIGVGMNITVYTPQDPGNSNILTASKLEIIK